MKGGVEYEKNNKDYDYSYSGVIVAAGLVGYLMPMFLLKSATKEMLPECRRAEYITDNQIMKNQMCMQQMTEQNTEANTFFDGAVC